MNTETGELYRVSTEEELQKLKKSEGEFLKEVSKQYEKEVNEILGDDNYAKADMSRSTPLTRWAKGEAKSINKRKYKTKRKMKKASRKRNRK